MTRPDFEDALSKHRREIQSLDGEILRLIAKRGEIAHEIGMLKRDARIPLRNYEVESRVVTRLRDRARELGLDGSVGEELAVFLIRRAVETQSPLVDSLHDGDRRRVLVVGGCGGMGRWVSRFLHVQGHTVRVHDPADAEGGFPRVSTLAEGAAWAELTLLAVPIGATAAALHEIASHNPPGVVAEMCSVKSHLVDDLSALRERGVRVVSFHPMFGPGARVLSGKQVLICRAGHARDEAIVEELFTATSAQVVPVDLAEHDRHMAAVLGMAHLLNVGFARALDLFGLSFAELAAVSGVTFRRQAGTTREVASENPRLYYEIQERNPHTKEVLRTLIDAFEEI
ncbi:MAG: prephenate dehydrogenase/arogenate dehydrogenase family protein, partial [Gemmatimonadota bacterium]|nr:prephenate dehydrogenase/arogenate dehydrogenase family protein [Gemmatimonadota bacterium]